MASQPSRSRGLRLETLENRCLLTAIGAIDGMGPVDGVPEGEATGPDYVQGQLIVKFAAGTSANVRNQILQQEEATLIQDFYGLDYALIQLPISAVLGDVGSISEHWLSKPQITHVEPNYYLYTPQLYPNDPLFNREWALNNTGQTGGFPDADIDAVEAWDIFTGSHDTVVAVIDTGVDYLHADLRDNMWHNPGEIAGDGLDNDGNGYIDDVYGIAPAIDATNTDPMDYNGHGTHVSGTIGAQGNNGIGVTGVNWDVQIMAINAFEGPLAGTVAAIASGISYATMMREQFGINVVVSNNSYGSQPGAPPSALEFDAIERHINSGIVFVASAGNATNNNDILAHYPSNYDLDGIIAVAATGNLDLLASYSSFGQTSVDLAAPGGDGADGTDEVILSTWPPGVDPFTPYYQIQGTSMAAPHVTGVVALVRGFAPDLTVQETKDLILANVDPLPWLQGIVLSGGRLNAANCLANIFASQVEGTVWSDQNANGIQDPSESGVANWTVYVDLNNNGVHNATEPSAVTDINGDYSIAAYLRPGSYTVRQVLQPKWTRTYPASGSHTVTFTTRGETITDIDFGNKPEPGTVSGMKWKDLDADGVHDANEPGIAGVYIYADLNNDGRIALGEPAAITGADGKYMIKGIPAGTVMIREVLDPGWEITYPVLGYHVVDVIPAANVANIDFANAASIDFGDAPAPYPTLLANGGASHGVMPGFHLGALIDGEKDGRPNATATGDDANNLADEDGVIISGPMFAGGTSSVDVIVTTSGYPSGYLQAWIDFNADGDWNDAGEQIAKNLRVGEGTHNISFAVPATATVGNSFARFRYALQRDLGPAGPATAGEVEDHAVLILKDEPVANPDSFEVQQDSINNALDVLTNDFPSSTGTLTITEVTQPEHGIVSIAPGGQGVLFTPSFGVFSPPLEVFTYTIDDGTGKTSSAEVSVFVRPQLVAPQAVDDIFRVAPGSGANPLTVLVNDLPGILGTMQLVSVTAPSFGNAVINNNGTADPLDDYVAYTPDGLFARLDQFDYTISNANGLSTATVTVLATPAPADLTVDFAIDFEDLAGNPISEINIGQQFVTVVSVQDVRTDEPVDEMGIFAAFMDLLYDRNLVLPAFDATNDLGFDITFSDSYPNGTSGDAETPGIIDEVGAFQSFDLTASLGPDKTEMFRIVFTASAAGVADFAADPADESPFHDTLYYSPPSVVDPADINYGLSSLTIVDPDAGGDGGGDGGGGGGGGEGEDLDVNADGHVSPIDVLMVVNHLNTAGSTPDSTGSSNPRLDVNHDLHVSPIDALLVINFLNNRGKAEGEGEGEAGGSVSVSSLTTTQDDLLASEPALTFPIINVAPTTVTEADVVATATPARAPSLPAARQDWLQQIGQETSPSSTSVNPDEVLSQNWESLLDTLAEDVLEAWFDGEDA